MKRTQQTRLRIRSWLTPLVYSVLAVTLGLVFPRVEFRWFPELESSMSQSAAMAICSAIASGMLALTGIVFSLTFVMVQFSATAYSPRLVLWVARDPVMSHAMGMFSATFLYALALLAWVDREATGRVPMLSGWLVMGLLLLSLGMFIALIERISLLQVNQMLIFTGDQGRRSIEERYPPLTGPAQGPETVDLSALGPVETIVYRGRPKVIQLMDEARLVQLATEADVVIELVAAVGDTVLERSALLRVHGSGRGWSEAELVRCIELGDERTFEQDPKYALRLLVDIAIKALSPAINDPTTAVQALDQIEDLLIRLGDRHLEIGSHRDHEGKLRLLIPMPGWEDFLLLALDEIRSCGANSVQVMRRMNALIKNVGEVLPPGRRPELRHWEERLRGTVDRTFTSADEKQDASMADRQGLGISEEKKEGG